jgi:23S rRNA (guanosine2251-2'-O)-methyltransferase
MRKLKLTELNRLSLDEYKLKEKQPLVLVMDNIRSGLNIGSAFRIADCFALEHIVLCGISQTPPHREIMRSAIGAEQSVDWSYEKDIAEALQKLKDAGYMIAGVEQTTESILLSDFEWSGEKPLALVLGNEVKGVSDEALPLLDVCLEVPQEGTKHSLNVSVCTGIVVYDLVRRIK